MEPENPIEQGSFSEAFANSLKVSSSKPETGQITSTSQTAKETADQLLARKSWEIQPGLQFIRDPSFPEGPIDPATQLAEVRQVPYALPKGSKWTTCDLSSDDMLTEACRFLNIHLCQGVNSRRSILSKEYLSWMLLPPGYKRSLHVGVLADTPDAKKLLAFISAVPANIRVGGEVVAMARINQLCVHKKLRDKGLSPILIRELTRRALLENIWQCIYNSPNEAPNWARILNPKKLVEIGYTELGPRMNMGRAIKLYSLPDAPLTPGFRPMEPSDVLGVERLLNDHLSQFKVAEHCGYLDVAHWFETKDDVVQSYVVANPETGDITDFCSFSIMNLTILGNPSHTTMKAAYSFYNVATKTSFVQLMYDALVACKQKNCDVFFASDVMHNESLLKELKFRKAEAAWSLYNYRLKTAMKP